MQQEEGGALLDHVTIAHVAKGTNHYSGFPLNRTPSIYQNTLISRPPLYTKVPS